MPLNGTAHGNCTQSIFFNTVYFSLALDNQAKAVLENFVKRESIEKFDIIDSPHFSWRSRTTHVSDKCAAFKDNTNWRNRPETQNCCEWINKWRGKTGQKISWECHFEVKHTVIKCVKEIEKREPHWMCSWHVCTWMANICMKF